LNAVWANDADLTRPRVVRLNKRSYERFDILRNSRMNSKKDAPRLFEGNPALNGDLPKILVQRHDDPRFAFGELKKVRILPAVALDSRPNDIVTFCAQDVDHSLRKVLVGEKPHLGWSRIALVFVGQVARIGQIGEDVISRETRIACQKLTLRLAGREGLENKLYRKTRPSDDRFPAQNLGIHSDVFRQRHTTQCNALTEGFASNTTGGEL
jgi:hypothetical protein